MISQILTKNITNITELKKNPVELSKSLETCVLSNGKPCFYSVSTSRMAELLKAESEVKALELKLYTAYDCAISALDLTDNSEIKMYLNDIIKCYEGIVE